MIRGRVLQRFGARVPLRAAAATRSAPRRRTRRVGGVAGVSGGVADPKRSIMQRCVSTRVGALWRASSRPLALPQQRCGFSALAGPAPPPPAGPPAPAWVPRANEALRLQPAACLLGLLASEGVTMLSFSLLFRVLALPVPLDVVGAVALSRALRRARVPLNLAAAAALARLYPALTMVRFPQIELTGSRFAARFAPPGSAQARAIAALDGAVAGFGPAYMVAARCVMAPLSVAACLAAIRSDAAAPLLAAGRERLAWLFPAAADAAAAGGDALAAEAAALAGHTALALIVTSPMFPAFAMAGVAAGRWVEHSRRARGGAAR